MTSRPIGGIMYSETHCHQVKQFDPEGIILSGQAEGLAKIAKRLSSLKGSFGIVKGDV
jgi:hypothetical protein